MRVTLTTGEVTALWLARRYPHGPVAEAREAERRRANDREALKSLAMAAGGLLLAIALIWLTP